MGAGRVVVPGEEPEPGNQDSFNRWVSRTWYDVVGSGDLRHYRAGTRVERIANFQQLCGYAAKRYIWNVRLAALLGIPTSAMTVDTLFTDRIRWGEQELQRRALKTARLRAAKPIRHPVLCKAEKPIHIVGSL